jgi:NADPH:quinone reductase-like Zn-dependent oxidoreductase
MKAYILKHYGGAGAAELQDVPTPAYAPHEVLVRVQAAGLNPVDYKTRNGLLKPIYSYPLPAIMGNELAGVVEAVGADVTRFKAGDRVFARTPKDAMGALAPYAAVPQDLLAHTPTNIDSVTAAGVPLAALTALQALRDELQLQQGNRVLITGGAGGVGTFAIQIAKWLGAEVITTASLKGMALVQRLGADRVIDYTQQEWAQEVRGVNAVFDLVGGAVLNTCFSLVKRGGCVLSVAGMPEPQTARKDLERGWGLAALFWCASLALRWRAWRCGVRYRYLFMHPSGQELTEIAALIEAGVVQPVIDRIFPLAEIEAAFTYLETGRAKGKIIVKISD